MLKEVLPVFPIFSSAQMVNAGPILSPYSNILYKDTVAYEVSWTGTPTGIFAVEGSNSYSAGLPQGGGPANSGLWTALLFPVGFANTTGTSGKILFNTDPLDFPWIRLTYTSTALAAQTVALVADVSGSLNSKYFLLNSGNNVNLYYVWFNINSAGVDPTIAGRTGIQVSGATNASASTLGTALATAVGAVDSSNDFSTSGTSTVTITNKVAGPSLPASDGTAPTGFTFTSTAGAGLLTGYVSGKSLG